MPVLPGRLMAEGATLALFGGAVFGVSELVRGVAADLPVHCVEDEVVGTWDIFAHAAGGGTGDQRLCGHRLPNTAAGNLQDAGVDAFGAGLSPPGAAFASGLFKPAGSVEL